ncbi:S-adenosylmethionine mitochondrial carrier protein [Platysternon megacephalum]|uniref:S-adenosylmethionine mitochondrial carrier protein n=1 Tax=Platysternon megacephalum TaxID=55544 RepID=A0A4D9EVE0_9SAUR|nr:S-adenosylmethionine mitochondrial carrier protein [Platysternon megacephalum]
MPCHRILVLLSFLILSWAPARASKKMGSEMFQNIYDAEANFHQTGPEKGNPVSRETMENSKSLNLLAAKGLSAANGSRHSSGDESGSSHKETRWALLEESAKRTLSLLPSLSDKKAMIVKKSSPGTKFSLSLDVPTHILKILIDLAKAKQMRAKAAANAELMAQIGRRK